MNACLCCSGVNYSECCGRFIDNQEIPSTPEELMRSRYTAFAQANVEYIADTMKSPAADNFDLEEARQAAQQLSWDTFEIVRSSMDGDNGSVEYIAYLVVDGAKHKLHKLCEFTRENGNWYFINGQDMRDQPSVH